LAASAASNIAVDNLAERLIALGIAVVRLGHPVRVLPSVQERANAPAVASLQRFRQSRRVIGFVCRRFDYFGGRPSARAVYGAAGAPVGCGRARA
jgi:hypothetical protein